MYVGGVHEGYHDTYYEHAVKVNFLKPREHLWPKAKEREVKDNMADDADEGAGSQAKSDSDDDQIWGIP